MTNPEELRVHQLAGLTQAAGRVFFDKRDRITESTTEPQLTAMACAARLFHVDSQALPGQSTRVITITIKHDDELLMRQLLKALDIWVATNRVEQSHNARLVLSNGGLKFSFEIPA